MNPTASPRWTALLEPPQRHALSPFFQGELLFCHAKDTLLMPAGSRNRGPFPGDPCDKKQICHELPTFCVQLRPILDFAPDLVFHRLRRPAGNGWQRMPTLASPVLPPGMDFEPSRHSPGRHRKRQPPLSFVPCPRLSLAATACPRSPCIPGGPAKRAPAKEPQAPASSPCRPAAARTAPVLSWRLALFFRQDEDLQARRPSNQSSRPFRIRTSRDQKTRTAFSSGVFPCDPAPASTRP